jgi:predicted SnoaL-like aldol condensation-catalyzing enzyme
MDTTGAGGESMKRTFRGVNLKQQVNGLLLVFLFGVVPVLGQGYLNSLESNKKVVFDFYRLVVEPRNTDLLEVYVAPDFLDHDPSDQKSTEGLAKRIKELGPAASDDVGPTLRKPPAFITAQGDLVIWIFAQNAPKAAEPFVVEIFRVKERKIVEHWKGVAKTP